jgi:HAD superfamily hydrolase (TIGR01549 family)
MPLSAIIFDLDNTLADTMAVCVESYQHTLQKYLDRWVPEDEISAEFGRSEEGILKTFVPDGDEAEILAEYLHHYHELHRPIRQPFSGVLPLLDLLQRRGVRVAIVTGKGEHSARISMAALGISAYIERLEFGHADYNNKTENINCILAEWGIDPSEVAYVGDTTDDMHKAREAGVLPVGAAWGAAATVQPNDGAAHIFYSVEDLHRWIEGALQFGSV